MSYRTSSTAVIEPGARPLGYAFLFFVVSFFTIPFLIGFILFPFFGLYFLYNIIHCGNHWIQVTPSKIDIHYAVCTVTIPRSEFVRASLRETGFRNLSVLTLQTVSGKYHFGLVDNPKYAEDIFFEFKNKTFYYDYEAERYTYTQPADSASQKQTAPSQSTASHKDSASQKQTASSQSTASHKDSASQKQTAASQNTASHKDSASSVTHNPQKSHTVPLTESERKGRELETSVFLSLASSDDIPGDHRELWDLYIPKPDGGYAQIDVLMIHETGIYVIECKNYTGWIFGSENNLYWYQTLYSGKSGVRKESFYNPILQNKSHINALSDYLNFQKEYINSCIVFGREAVLKAVPEDDQYCFIEKYQRFEGKLMNRICSSPRRLSVNEITSIYSVLLPCTNVPEEVKKKHKQNIREKYR